MDVAQLSDPAEFLRARRAASARRRGPAQPDPRPRGHVARPARSAIRSSSCGSSKTRAPSSARPCGRSPTGSSWRGPRPRPRCRRSRRRLRICPESSAAYPRPASSPTPGRRGPARLCGSTSDRASMHSSASCRRGPPRARAAQAGAADRELLLDWLRAFADEALGEVTDEEELQRMIDIRVTDDPDYGFVLWEDDGRPVSLTGFGEPDPERDPHRARLHATRVARPRLRERARRGCVAGAARRRTALLLPLHRPRQPDVEQDLRRPRLRARLRLAPAFLSPVAQRGMLPCLRFGFGSRFVSETSSAEIRTGRVRRGSITSST